MFPNKDNEYDALIKLEKLESKNRYRLSVPRIIESSSGWPTVTLIYSSHELDKDCKEETLSDGTHLLCIPQKEIREEINLNNAWEKAIDWVSNKNSYVGEIQIMERENFSVEVSVMWETEVCLTFGRKVIIK
ncbi:hypothetical protein [Pseudoalteromonas byunsanensis]|uniref:Uncharacterized protein n=1 Tax=Pseudoalteromonas byunsanensis TaxID=327939 RepID=A0A1S1N301_9GAMM|nr:hypothetical protein [Pseudoalteromonas byunsanensis]OHU94380.1 hypothetical protein BIW53_14980 [Pseudoalteromonas byunsanensis]